MMKPMCLTQRKAAVTSGRPGQRAIVRAQQPHRPASATTEIEQRQDRLLGLADEFTNHWVKGIKQGPTQEVVRALHTVTNTDIDIQSVKPLGKSEFKGVDGLRDYLTLEANREGTLIPTRIAIAAAAEEDDVVFGLLEGEATQKRPLLGASSGTSTGGGEYVHRAYGIAKFDTLVDDVSRAVTGVNERWQLSLHDATLLAKAVPFPVGDTPETGDREQALIKTLEKSGAELFPKDRIRAINYDRDAARRNLDKWVEARTTGKNETTLLQEAFEQASLRTWDVMGVLPLICGMKRGKEHGAAPTDTIFNYAGTLAFVRDAKARNNIVCSRIDAAVSREYNIGFLHWKSHITPQGASKDQEHTFEGLEMHVFNEQGKITDIWMLRDPSKPEEDMMASLLGPRKAAQHVVSHKLQN